MLGWEIEVEDARNYDVEDGLTAEAEARVTEILGKRWIDRSWCEPINFWSAYEYCDYMYIGLELMNNHIDCLPVGEYGQFLASNADLLVKTAYEIYEAIMGEQAECPPIVMCIGSEG